MLTAFILLTDSLKFTDKAGHINILNSILLHRLGYGGEVLRQIRLPLMTATDIVDHVESTTYLMEVEECRELVKEALHYHCLPPRQSILQVPIYCLPDHISGRRGSLGIDRCNSVQGRHTLNRVCYAKSPISLFSMFVNIGLFHFFSVPPPMDGVLPHLNISQNG